MSFEPLGTVIEGETWYVQLATTEGVFAYGYKIPTGKLIGDITVELAKLINDDTARGFTAFVRDGTKLFIVDPAGRVDAAGHGFTASFAIGLTDGTRGGGATLLDLTAPAHPALTHTLTLSGSRAAGEAWTITLKAGDIRRSYGQMVRETVPLAEIATALAGKINAAGTGFVASVEGNTLVIVDANTTPTGDSVSFSITSATSTAGSFAKTTALATTRFALAGTSRIGETWTVTIGANAYAYEIESLQVIAAGLAGAINEDTGTGFTAVASGDKLIVTNRLGDAFTAQGAVTPTLRPAGAVEVLRGKDASGKERVPAIDIRIGGVPVTGAIWTLRLEVGGVAYSFDYKITSDHAWQTIATAFADLVNARALQAGSALAGLTAAATADGTLLIADIAGRGLAASVSLVPVAEAAINGGGATTTLVKLVGTPQANELWRLRIGDVADDVVRDLRYEVELGDSVAGVTLANLAQFTTALAWKLNNDPAAARYTAIADGTRIAIVDRNGGAFETRLESGAISRREGYADITLDYSLSATQMQAQLRALYGFDDLVVEAARNSGDVTYTVTFVRNQAGIDQQQIRWTETAQRTGLVPNPDASVNVITATVRNGATVNAGINNLQTVTINPNVTGGTFTLTFRIQNARGEFELFETKPIAYNAGALDVFKLVSPILNPNGATIDVDKDFDFATRTPSRPYTDNFAVRKVGNVFLITFQGAYRSLAIHDIDTRC
ncbi:MAG: hypothetical protein IPK39_05800 [Sulfuritalea sp.]|nr:hypothetical protein [Sulfuritalea sp.]